MAVKEEQEGEGSEREDCARIVCPECTVAMRMAGGRVKVERMEGRREGRGRRLTMSIATSP